MLGLARSVARLDYWPEATEVGDRDITVDGMSLAQLAEVCGTPVVHSAASVVPDSGGIPSTAERTAVLVVRVIAAERHVSGMRILQVDARLDNLRLIWSETRLIGRVPTPRQRMCLVVRAPDQSELAQADDAMAVQLPADVQAGDLLAIPSRSICADSPEQLHPLTGRTDWRPDSVFGPSDAELRARRRLS